MIAIRNVLCPTDFSEFSQRALAHAVTLARWYEARLTVLHVLPLVPTAVGFPPLVSPITWEPVSRERLLEEVKQFAAPAAAAGVAADAAVVEGPAVRMILERAREIRADLVVMGTHGRGGFEKWVLGSVTEKVLRQAPCPVLTVSRPAEGRHWQEAPLFRTVVCGIDFSEASRAALEYALSLAQQAKSRLRVLHVLDWDPREEVREHRHFNVPEYRRYLEEDARRLLQEAVPASARDWCEVRETVSFGKPWRRIVDTAAEDGAELIVLGVHGGALDRLLFGSTTHHVVREAPCPVLVVRAEPGRHSRQRAG
jgi:nucleotide-binding universal stress UspA family protein